MSPFPEMTYMNMMDNWRGTLIKVILGRMTMDTVDVLKLIK